MKKIVLILILIGGAGAGVYYWRSTDSSKKDEGPTLGKVTRGPIKQIVASTGKVVSNLDVDIKCKASGTVSTLPFDVSDSVNVDDVVCKIDERDMRRVKDQATVTLDSSMAKLASAKENLVIAELTLKTDTDRAKANLESAEVAAHDAHAKAERMKELFDKKLVSQEDLDTAVTAASQAESNLDSCRIKIEELKTQETALEVQRQNVKLAEGEVESDKISLEIATDAFTDCTVKAPKCVTTQPVGQYIPPEWVVTARAVQTGMIIASAVSNVGGGTTIMTLSDMSRIFVLASVDESDIGKVAVDQPATITVDAYPGLQFAGKVVRIASKGVNTSNVVTFEVKIEVLGALKRALVPKPKGPKPDKGNKGPGGNKVVKADKPGADTQSSQPAMVEKPNKSETLDLTDLIPEKKSLLKPEMTANIEIITAERKDSLLIPVLAVSRISGQFYANVPDTDETPQKKPIEIGISDGENYELIAGLVEADTVVIRKDADSRWANNNNQRGQNNSSMRMMRMTRGR